jgi:hypothetical protein
LCHFSKFTFKDLKKFKGLSIQSLANQISIFFVFQINQEHLREGNKDGKSILNALPQTVSGNVKNVTGWRGGAERGFLSVYSDCIHVIRTEGLKFYSQDMITKYMKVLYSDTTLN